MAAAASLAMAAIASADPGPGHGAPFGASGTPAGGQDMMQMMMRMHSQMMGGGAMHGGGMTGPGGPSGGMDNMPMMGGGPSRMGMGNMPAMGMMAEFDTDEDGVVSSEELRTGLQNLHDEYDANGDGSLSLDEFEDLHSAQIREMMVDRFQFLDNDGDGRVTQDEMAAPADRMQRMETMREQMMQGDESVPGRMMPGSGGMMEGGEPRPARTSP